MRAFHNLLALSSLYDVYLLVLPNSSGSNALDPATEELCAGVCYLPLSHIDLSLLSRLFLHKTLRRFSPAMLHEPVDFAFINRQRLRSAATRGFRDKTFDLIYAFRLYTLPYAYAAQTSSPSTPVALDLDEIESVARRDIAMLCRSSGNTSFEKVMTQEAHLYEMAEKRLLPGVDWCFVSSYKEKEDSSMSRLVGKTVVLPNIALTPEAATERQQRQSNREPYVFIMVGSYAHYPNLDGALFFCKDVLPLLRREIGAPFTIFIIGGGIPKGVARALSLHPEVHITGEIPDLSGFYAHAAASIVPIRAGGGTRLKILEAFSHSVPVISTAKGAEGINAEKDVHLLIADDAAGFATQCRRIITEPALADNLSHNASLLMAKEYSLNRLKEIFSTSLFSRDVH